MTDRAEIERLLQMTGRTLEELPIEYSTAERIDCVAAINTEQGAYRRASIFADRILHQSDVIELLVGALRDALAKVPKWISVAERLPEPFVSVLVQMPGEEPHPTVREGFISNDGIWCAGHFKREPDEVTHWAKMPEPPKEGK